MMDFITNNLPVSIAFAVVVAGVIVYLMILNATSRDRERKLRHQEKQKKVQQTAEKGE